MINWDIRIGMKTNRPRETGYALPMCGLRDDAENVCGSCRIICLDHPVITHLVYTSYSQTEI